MFPKRKTKTDIDQLAVVNYEGVGAYGYLIPVKMVNTKCSHQLFHF